MDKATYLAAKHTIARNAIRHVRAAAAKPLAAARVAACMAILLCALAGFVACSAIFWLPFLPLLTAWGASCGPAPDVLCHANHVAWAPIGAYWALSALSYAAMLSAAKGARAAPSSALSPIRRQAVSDMLGKAATDFCASCPAELSGPDSAVAALRLHGWKFAAAALGWPFHAGFQALSMASRTPAALDSAMRRLAQESPEILALHEAALLDQAAAPAEGGPDRPRL